MATGIPQWALGKDCTVTITPQVVAADGTFSDHSIGALVMNGRIDDVSLDTELTTENISPMHSFGANPVPYESSSKYSITENTAALPLVSSVGTNVFGKGNVLRAVSVKSFYHKLKIDLYDHTATTPVIKDSQTCYVLMSTPQKRTFSKNKVQDVAMFESISIVDTSTNVYTSNPALTDYTS